MSQSYEYSYSTGGSLGGSLGTTLAGTLGTGVGGYSVEYSSGSNAGDILVGGSGSLNAGGSTVLVSSGGAQSSSNTVGQIAQDLLSLGSGAGAGAGGAFVAGGAAGGAFGAGGAAGGNYTATYSTSVGGSIDASAFSEIEQLILRANNPIQINESEVITVNGQSGIWANKAEIVNWRGVIPITQYLINEDVNPEVIRKRTEQQLIYEQEIAIRYLRPPTPPPPGEILIRQEKNIATPPAPPLVIRQQPPRPETPAPLIIREAPPKPPAAIGAKVVTISGKRLPPPPRKVIIERLAPLPSKPQSIMIERWLPYNQTKRRVIFQRNSEPDPIIAKPRNVIVQWEAPAVTIKKEFKDLGVIRANPNEYVQRYGATLKTHIELPSFVKEIRPPTGVVLAAEYQAPSLYELEGDIQALGLIDLEREGLGEYRTYIARFGGAGAGAASFGSASFGGASFSGAGAINVNSLFAELFASVDRNADGRISIREAEKLLLRLNSRLGRSYGEDDVRVFFKALDVNGDGWIDYEEFRRALLRQFS